MDVLDVSIAANFANYIVSNEASFKLYGNNKVAYE